METRKRKFFAELLDATRELQLQIQAAQKRRKQRNDGVQARFFLLVLYWLKSCMATLEELEKKTWEIEGGPAL